MTIDFKRVSEKVYEAMLSAGHDDVEYYDDRGNRLYSIVSNTVDGEKIAMKFYDKKDKIVVTIMDGGEEKSEINVHLSNDQDIEEFASGLGDRLRTIAHRNGGMSYNVRTWGRELKPRDFSHNIKDVKEGTEMEVQEGRKAGWKGTTRSSYSRIGECRIIVRHSERVNEEKMGARTRNIEAIFVETKSGERFKMKENNIHGARAMARHISNGGAVHDAIGTKITEMTEKMANLRGIYAESSRLHRSQPLSEEVNSLHEQIRKNFIGIRETLKRMSGKKGYVSETEKLEEYSVADTEIAVQKSPMGKVINAVQDALEQNNINGRPIENEEWALAARAADKLEQRLANPRHSDKLTPEEGAAFKSIAMELGLMKRPSQESIQESKNKVDGKTKKETEKEKDEAPREDQVPVFDRPVKGKDRLSRDPDDLFSVNESQLPEFKLLENAFDELSTVEFFKEDDLFIEEDKAPEIKATLPENAFHNLNMYVGHPLFKHYVKTYEAQGIMDDVMTIVEEDTKLWEEITNVRQNLSEYEGGMAVGDNMGMDRVGQDDDGDVDTFQQALEKVKALISDRRMSLEEAIHQVAEEMARMSANPESVESFEEQLWGAAEEAGLVNHDMGRTFDDDVLGPDKDVDAAKAEINAEEFYGDARFAESQADDAKPEGEDRYENVFFAMGEEATEFLDMIDEKGPEATLDYIGDIAFQPGKHDMSPERAAGSSDNVYEEGAFILSWNPRMGYVGLEHDTQMPQEELDKTQETMEEPTEMGDISRIRQLAGMQKTVDEAGGVADPHGGSMISPYNDELSDDVVDNMYDNVKEQIVSILKKDYSNVSLYDEELDDVATDVANSALSMASSMYGEGDEYYDYIDMDEMVRYALGILHQGVDSLEGIEEGDPFMRHKKDVRNSDRSMINPEDKIDHKDKFAFEDEEIDENFKNRRVEPDEFGVDVDQVHSMWMNLKSQADQNDPRWVDNVRQQIADEMGIDVGLVKRITHGDIASRMTGMESRVRVQGKDVEEAKARPDWAYGRERGQEDRLDRSGYGRRGVTNRNDAAPSDDKEDKYAAMARKYDSRMKQKPQAAAPKHMRKENVEPEVTISEDARRIIQLARHNRR